MKSFFSLVFIFHYSVFCRHWGQEIVGRLGETRWGRLTKAFVTLSQTQQIRPISTLSQIRPISSRDRPLLRRTDKLPSWSSTAPGFLFGACLSFFNAWLAVQAWTIVDKQQRWLLSGSKNDHIEASVCSFIHRPSVSINLLLILRLMLWLKCHPAVG